jgi:antitoxin HigA-1
MAVYAALRDPNRCPSHPGVAMADILEDIPLSRVEVARRVEISRQHLYDLLHGVKPLSPHVAAKVSAAFGGSTESWLRMQAAYDAWHAEREVDVSGIKELVGV